MSDFYKVFIEFDRWKLYLEGLKNSVIIGLCGFLLAFLFAIIISVFLYYLEIKKKLKWLRYIINAILSVVRAIPLLLHILIGYFVVFAFMNNAVIVAILVFGFNSSAYLCEVIRGGLNSVQPSQIEAGRSLGFGDFGIVMKILLPQALKNCLPSIQNEAITIFKMTSLTGWISIVDLTQAANIISSNTFIYFLPLIIVAIVYVVLVALIGLVFKFIEKKLKKYD